MPQHRGRSRAGFRAAPKGLCGGTICRTNPGGNPFASNGRRCQPARSKSLQTPRVALAHLVNARKPVVNYQSLIGRQWAYGVNDCFSLVREFFGLQSIRLPDFDRPEDLETSPSIFLEQAERIGFRQVAYANRQPGDVVIMRLGTRFPMHAAVLVDYDRILHQRQDSLSTEEPLTRYYVERIAAVFRYGANRQAAG